MDNEVPAGLPGSITFKSASCDEMHYFITVDRTKFDVERFRSNFPKGKHLDRYGTVCAPRDPDKGDYHVHAEWRLEGQDLRFMIEYYQGAKKHESDEHEPFAEEFMEWLGQFFGHENAHSHIHAEFAYELESRESRFLLPLKTKLGPEGEEAVINGVTITLPTEPAGVRTVWVTRGKKNWRVQVAADRRITFKGFSPYPDMSASLSVVEKMILEKKL